MVLIARRFHGITNRHRRSLLLLTLSAELLCAFTLRWPRTTSTLQNEAEYLLGQHVIASENWRREGALANHFIPSRSIDQRLPEWVYRDAYWRDYLSQPPLGFMLHYWASRVFERADPVIAGKILAQLLTAAGIVGAAGLLFDVFGFGATLAGLSFLIWGKPFLVWFIDGYYSTTPAMLFQLVLCAWCLFVLRRRDRELSVRPSDLMIAALLAYLGVLSEWVALFGNVVIVATFLLAGLLLFRRSRSAAVRMYALAFSVALASVAAVASMVALYGTKVGFSLFWAQFMSRVDERTGQSEQFVPYTRVLIDQMKTCWPGEMLAVLSGMVVIALAYCVSRQWRYRGRPAALPWPGYLVPVALVIGFGPGVTYCYWLKNLVTIHWWFAGTWAIGWAMTICAFCSIARIVFDDIIHAGWSGRCYAGMCLVLTVGGIVWNAEFVGFGLREGSGLEGKLIVSAWKVPNEVYRALGRALPGNGDPLVVFDMPDLFADYPFATAYLRRPVVRSEAPGKALGKIVKLGTTEDAVPDLLRRGGLAYVAYDRSLRQCAGKDVTPIGWDRAVPLGVCRVGVASLVQQSTVTWRPPLDPAGAFLRWIDETVGRAGCCGDPQSVLKVTRLLDSRLRLRSGEIVAAARSDKSDDLRRLIEMWPLESSQGIERREVAIPSPSLLGIVAGANRWYVLLANLAGADVPEFHQGMQLLINGRPATVLTPYQGSTNDRRARLPLSVIEIEPLAGLPSRDLVTELVDNGTRLVRTVGGTLVNVPERPAEYRAAEALLRIASGCSGVPGAPTDLRVEQSHTVVQLRWIGSTGHPSSYVLEAGGASGSTATANDLGNPEPRFTGIRVERGTYYARIRGKNACGVGAPSNEVVVVVR